MESESADQVLSLVFVHGFQGDHTSFQSFPTDLHLTLLPHIPTLQTFVYPTYKARRSIEHATADFMLWMSSALPPGPVVLLGHSMGGILIVEAAFREGEGGERVVGLINFDVPFLGVHPHVVVSGLASLFKNKDSKSEHEVNDPSAVNLPHTAGPSPNLLATTSSSSLTASTSSTSISLLKPPPSLHLSRPPPPREPNELLSLAFSTLHLGSPPKALTSKLHWLSKHRSAPFTGAWKHVSETMEFAGCLVDPGGLWKRYDRLVGWGKNGWMKGTKEGKGRAWVNYWTETVPKIPPAVAEGGGEEQGGTGETEETGDGAQDEGPEENEEEEEDEAYLTAEEGEGEETDAQHDAVRSETMAAALLLGGVDGSTSTSTLSSEITTTTSPSTGTEPGPETSTVPSSIAEPVPADGKADAEPGDTSLNIPITDAANAQSDPDKEYTPEERKAVEKAAKQAQKELDRAEKAAQKEREKAAKAEQKEREASERSAQKEAERVQREAKKSQQLALRDAERRAQAAAKAAKPEEAHHFIVLPFNVRGTKEWVRVEVDGVGDEVEAHCAVFFREKNSRYEALVEDVGARVRGIWERLK